MKRVLLILLSGLALLSAVLVFRTTRFSSKQIQVEPVADIAVDAAAAAEHLAGALRFRTISYQDAARFDGDEFLAFHEFLEQSFPNVHSSLAKETVAGYSLLYRWDGTDPGRKPILLMAHMDVVPVEPGTESEWTHPPFDGRIADGYVWGRGAMDDKGTLIATLEAVETLLSQRFASRRTVYLAFGHDEEVGGPGGAVRIAELLGSRRVELEFVLDEGGIIAEEVTGIPDPIALIGVAEKGYVSLELTLHAEGGHSSMPPKETAVGGLSAAVRKLEENQIRGGIRGATAAMFDYLGPELPFLQRLFIANRWLFGGLVERRYGATPEGRAALRTTTAPTIFQAGVKDNVLPSSARAVVNFRLLPGDSIGSVIEHVRRTIDNPSIEIRTLGVANEPSPMSDVHSPSFMLLQRTVRQIFPTVVVAPWLLVGGTDSRHYLGLTTNVYRFDPFPLGPEDLKRFHGKDERLAVDSHANMIRFYIQLLRNSAT